MSELDLDLDLDEYKATMTLWREITETQQYAMATNLIKALRGSFPDLPKGVTGDALLDALGCEGLSLIVGEYAGNTYRDRAGRGFPKDGDKL